MSLIIPTSYFPNIEYFHQLLQKSDVKISTAEIFQKQTYRNRCVIINANGLQNLTVPVERNSGEETLTKNIKISYAEDWQKNHLRSIESAYRRTPYYEYYIDSIEKIILKNHVYLVDLNFELTEFLVQKIGLSCELKLEENNSEIKPEILEMMNPKTESKFQTKTYIQTFIERFGFQNNLSILDLLFNEGPNCICVLQESVKK